jgi:hypothetical protein
LSAWFSRIVETLARIDGETVACDDNGVTSFNRIPPPGAFIGHYLADPSAVAPAASGGLSVLFLRCRSFGFFRVHAES